VELPIEREDVQAIMAGLLNINWKLDRIISYLVGDDDGEDEEDSS
jgi:hypothetical protein